MRASRGEIKIEEILNPVKFDIDGILNTYKNILNPET